jgi:hypothetical protein
MAFVATPGSWQIKAGAAAVTVVAPSVNEISDTVRDKDKSFGEKFNSLFGIDGPLGLTSTGFGHSKSGGISSVPYNGYQATLHRGESVLPRGEARDYRNGGVSRGGATVNLNGPVNIHTEADYQTFVQRLARDIDEAGNAMGGAK